MFFWGREGGQVTSIDVIIAAILFIMMFLTLRGFFFGNLGVAQQDSAYLSAQVSAQQALDALIKTKGYPTNWSAVNVQIIGLARKENVLDETKISDFLLLDYEASKALLALEGYDFNFELNATNPADNKSYGANPSATSKVVSLFRQVVYKGGDANVTFKVFYE